MAVTATILSPLAVARLVEELQQRDFVVLDDLFPQPMLLALRRRMIRLRTAAAFRPAGVGRGPSFQVRPEVRCDWVRWLEAETARGIERTFLGAMDELLRAVNQSLLLGLRGFEGHMTVYPTGTFYARHLDRFRDASHRTLSCILYLNPDWQTGDGGELVIYKPDDPQQIASIEEPRWGRFVCFLSATVPHEVRTTATERYSLTGWLWR